MYFQNQQHTKQDVAYFLFEYIGTAVSSTRDTSKSIIE